MVSVGRATLPGSTTIGWQAGCRERCTEPQSGVDGCDRQVDLAHQGRNLVAPPLQPLGIIGSRPAVASSLGLEAGQGSRIIPPGLPVIAHAIQVKSVQLVVGRQLGIDRDCIVHHIGVTGIEIDNTTTCRYLIRVVGHQPVATARDTRPVHVEGVGRIDRWRSASPNGQRGGPGVHLDASSVRALNQMGQGIKARGSVRCPGIDRRGIVGIPASPHLDHQGVEISGPGGFDQLVDLLLGLDAIVVGIHPQGAEFIRTRRASSGQAHVVHEKGSIVGDSMEGELDGLPGKLPQVELGRLPHAPWRLAGECQ